MTELQNMTFREIEICGEKRTKNGLEIVMWNKEKCGLSVCTEILGVGNKKGYVILGKKFSKDCI